MNQASETTATNHNHITRDIRPEGQCPACDIYWASFPPAPAELLEQIEARIVDCRTYNFGMRNADKLAHEDAPLLLAAVKAVVHLADAIIEQSAVAPQYGHDIKSAIAFVLEDAK
jgi:hypothetical protein